jgi:uncharacterized membrane protein
MGAVEQSVEVAAPVASVYDQCIRFEDFPDFMEGIEEVHQLDETHVRWRMRIAGEMREFDAEIIEQRPCERIVWRATTGDVHTGSISFERVDDATTRVVLRVEPEPDGRFGRVWDASRHVRVVQGDLHRFKAMIEAATARVRRI